MHAVNEIYIRIYIYIYTKVKSIPVYVLRAGGENAREIQTVGRRSSNRGFQSRKGAERESVISQTADCLNC